MVIYTYKILLKDYWTMKYAEKVSIPSNTLTFIVAKHDPK